MVSKESVVMEMWKMKQRIKTGEACRIERGARRRAKRTAIHRSGRRSEADTTDGRTGRARAAGVSSAPRLARVARPRCRSRLRARSTMKSKVKGARTKNMDKLIAAVQARECLWDKSYRGHRNRFKLERYWNEVAAEVGTTSLNCRKKWKNLKDQCRKEMKKNPTESEWPHFQKLKFIHHQFMAEDEEGDEDTTDEVFNSLDESIKRPKLGYTMRKKLLMNKRRTIDVDMNKLIDLVRVREIIWNRSLKGHHNWYKLDESWKEIAQELDCTRDEARLKWKYLRDQARKEVRKPMGSDWEYLPKLQFLTNQFNDYEGNELADDQYTPDQDYDADQGSSYYNIEPTNEVSVKEDDFDEFDTKPIIMETDFYDDDDDAQKNATAESSEPTKDEDIGFFNSLLPHVKKLGPAKKLMLRMKIQELVYNTVYNES